MLDNGKITANQYKTLVLLFTIGSSILVAPTALVNDAKQDAWIATIFYGHHLHSFSAYVH